MKSPIIIDICYDYSADAHFFDQALADRRVIHAGRECTPDLSSVKYALVWNPDNSIFSRMPNLEVVFSLGAGVDHVLTLPVPAEIPIVRFVDPSLTVRMSEWICHQCLNHLRRQREFDALQRRSKWEELYQPMAGEVTVGIVGFGVLGRDAGRRLQALGFNVIGWSRSGNPVDGFDIYDASGLDDFLSRTDILIGLLPLTAETTGIFNRQLFANNPGRKRQDLLSRHRKVLRYRRAALSSIVHARLTCPGIGITSIHQ